MYTIHRKYHRNPDEVAYGLAGQAEELAKSVADALSSVAQEWDTSAAELSGMTADTNSEVSGKSARALAVISQAQGPSTEKASTPFCFSLCNIGCSSCSPFSSSWSTS